MGKNGIVLLFRSHSTGLAPKTLKSWVRSKMKRPSGHTTQLLRLGWNSPAAVALCTYCRGGMIGVCDVTLLAVAAAQTKKSSSRGSSSCDGTAVILKDKLYFSDRETVLTKNLANIGGAKKQSPTPAQRSIWWAWHQVPAPTVFKCLTKPGIQCLSLCHRFPQFGMAT